MAKMDGAKKIRADGEPELSQGAGLSLDTSTTSTHSIIYKAVDQTGNTATATRTVEVVEPQ